jgi:alkylation response protein AidB-like acyl-CoA dehydrogenase
MDFAPSDRVASLLERIREFMEEHVDPVEREAIDALDREVRPGVPYPDILIELRERAHGEGLWNLFLPDERFGPGLTNWEYGMLCELMGRSGVAPMVFNCSAPDTGNMEILAEHGTDEQKQRWLPGMLSGEQIGAYSLSEPQAGSDAAAVRCAATRSDDGGYVLNGAKSWITHGGRADFYTLFARTGVGSRGVSCFLIPAGLTGLSFGKPEEKMGLHAVPTTSAFYDHARVEEDRLIGEQGQGLQIAFSALDSGRLGIAAVAVGLAQAALEEAAAYANQRTTFGRKIIDHQGLGFVLADMAAAVTSARATYLDAARRRDAGRPYSTQASVAKLIATDAAMKVTTDAVQVLGGAGYTRDYRVERYMREAKIMQIFEGTNQIQRLVIARALTTK